MCGNGGTVYDPTPPTSPCERLTFRTVLNSPVPNVVWEIAKRFQQEPVRLDIQIQLRGTLQIAVALLDQQVAGAITSDALVRLIECIRQGNEYVAEVRSIAGARVEVQVVRK